MGHHYIPQEYLRGFSHDKDIVYKYDPKKNEISTANIESIFQKKAFHTPELETRITKEIENPANIAIKKLIGEEQITSNEKLDLAKYIFWLMIRGPKGKSHVVSKIPELKTEFKAAYAISLENRKEKGEITDNDLINIKNTTWSMIDEMSDEALWHGVIEPTHDGTIRPYEYMANMYWDVLKSTDGQFFTSDNPVLRDKEVGLSDGRSAFFLAISSNRILRASWEPTPQGYRNHVANRICQIYNTNLVRNTEILVVFKYFENWMPKYFPKIRKIPNAATVKITTTPKSGIS